MVLNIVRLILKWNCVQMMNTCTKMYKPLLKYQTEESKCQGSDARAGQ